MKLSLTLDTNCIIAVDEQREESSAVIALAEAHRSGTANVALVAISASERQREGKTIETFSKFQARLATLGLGHLELLEPMTYWDLTFWDHGLWCNDEMETLERSIHEVLFPNIHFLWTDYCAELGLNPKTALLASRWKNAKCDVQAFWSHAFRKRDVFVTSDKNFHAESKKSRLLSIAGGRIEHPTDAAALVNPRDAA